MTSREMHGLERKKFSSVHLLYIVLGLGVVIVAYPLFWMVMSSFKTYNEIYRNVWGLPGHLLFSNYTEAWTRGISRYFFNSVLVTAATIVGVLPLHAASEDASQEHLLGADPAVYCFQAASVDTPDTDILPCHSQGNRRIRPDGRLS